MDSTETVLTLGTQDTGQRQTKQKKPHIQMNEQRGPHQQTGGEPRC
jgi:hypothetical protein